MYNYKAFCTRVIDGDTIVVDIDLGFNTWIKGAKIRFFGINAYEKSTKKGLEATEFLINIIEGEEISLQTIKLKKGKNKGNEKKGKYGRFLGVIFYQGKNINNFMIKNNFAVNY